jgi:signal transduction histidine kinase/ligand-binding sensor domain-containing protein
MTPSLWVLNHGLINLNWLMAAAGKYLFTKQRALKFFCILPCHLLVLICSPAAAQSNNIKRYSIQDGLVNNDILNIYQDSQGFIWLCTRGGLSRYDGNRFTNYTTSNGLTGDMINAIYEITPEHFIIAQNSGGPRLLFNGSTTDFGGTSHFTINRFFRDSNHRLLAASDEAGVVYLKNNTFLRLNRDFKMSAQSISKINDSLWIAMEHLKTVQLFNEELDTYSIAKKLDVTCLYTDLNNSTWVGTDRGLMLLAPDQRPNDSIRFAPLPSKFNLSIVRESYIADMMQDSRQDYWIATNAGLLYLKKDGSYRIFTDADGLPSPAVNCLKEDNQHNIWIGTSFGLAKFSPNNEIKIFADREGVLPADVNAITPVSNSRVLFFQANAKNEMNLETGKVRRITSTGKVYQLGGKKILVEENSRAVIYDSGISTREIAGWPQGKFDNVVQIGEQDFIGTHGNQLYGFSNGTVTQLLSLHIPDPIWAFTLDKRGLLWAGTVNSGLFKIAWSKQHERITLTIKETLTNLLPDNHIRALFTDRPNEVWIGTRYKGAVRLMEHKDGQYTAQSYGTNEGLSSNFARTIARDSANNIWVGTMQGLDKLIPQNDGYRVFNFGKLNNIFSQVFNVSFLSNSYFVAGGFPHLIYGQDVQQDTLSPPTVYITKVYNDNIDSKSNSLSLIPYNKAQINFEFSAPQFINEKITRYAYRLLGGNDTSWTMAGSSQNVFYASLRPGKYSFEVRPLGFNGQWGNSATHRFEVTTPFWERTWFLIALIVGLLSVIYAFYRYRIRQLMQLQKVRNRIATDLHDEIGSNLTNISILSTLSTTHLSQPAQAKEFLQRISEEVTASSQALDDIIWSVNAGHDTLDETVSRMRRYAAELFDGAGINYELQLDPLLEEMKLDMEQRRDFYLIYKEGVNNILKHASASQVKIIVDIDKHRLTLHMTDNGKGFDLDRSTGRHGLSGMRDRTAKWKGKFEITSSQNIGTTIKISMPLAN